MLGGLPIIGGLSMLGALVLGTFTVNAMAGHLAGLIWLLASAVLWLFFAYLYSEDPVFMPLFWIKRSTRFSNRTDSFAPSSQEWEILP